MKKFLGTILALYCIMTAAAQKIDYSVVDKDDYREMNFEIIGKVGGNISVYKNFKNRHDICVYDNEMQMKNRVKMDFLPERVINVDFIAYPDFAYMIYQYQKRNVVYCSMVKINGEGKLMTDPVDLDTSQTNGTGESKVYTMVNSDDKKKIVLFKIKRINDKNYQLTSFLYNNQMELQKRSRFGLYVPDREGNFTDFMVDNDGDFVFGRATRTGNREYVNKVDLVFKRAMEDTITKIPLAFKDKSLDEVKLKFDNFNKRIILTSFFYKQKKREH